MCNLFCRGLSRLSHQEKRHRVPPLPNSVGIGFATATCVILESFFENNYYRPFGSDVRPVKILSSL